MLVRLPGYRYSPALGTDAALPPRTVHAQEITAEVSLVRSSILLVLGILRVIAGFLRHDTHGVASMQKRSGRYPH